ncbi:Protein phosphatase 1, regulatory subunit, and related proteins [Plasmopara halstedii]|uniref:Protein phosphatase 1, regulatory subunit, and related proteins n=1 Tax=Plasmopara halstedii TaxID=4781 RepID=A0A0P1AVF1_PLAHL|nr:Protein phosphatase 1, regulatory subunit, and related proteins [Plasmopara halstedii]CEG46301.1 Protein phosphatase 1, regulatory subunit, and related proteins [Plasmopara halstedii]|eukprot:XP_024582670.1 Protein phosphatase 1, regulatory subunit, and related proteins [Plasmopara halstedii]
MSEETYVRTYAEGLSRIDRVVDDSGYAFTALDVAEKGLASLEPIKSYSHLLFVNVSKNQISDASPLLDLSYLVCVDLSKNVLKSTPDFPQPYLQSLDVSDNQITSLQGLSSASLTVLKINGNGLTSLVGLQNLPSIKTLEAARNDIIDVESLANDTAPRLETLHLDENKITTIMGIETLQELKTLSIQQNYIESFESIQQLRLLTKLTSLNLTGNPVTQAKDYRESVILLAPLLKHLDGETLTDEDRFAALELKRRREMEAMEQAEEK